MEDEISEELLELRARCDGLTIMVGAMASLLVRYRLVPDAEFTTALHESETRQRTHNEHQALIETLRLVREMAEEMIAARDGDDAPLSSGPNA